MTLTLFSSSSFAEQVSADSALSSLLQVEKEIEDYIGSSFDLTNSAFKIDKDVRVRYVGYTPAEIERNRAEFPNTGEFVVSHDVYGRIESEPDRFENLDFAIPGTLTVYSVDLSRKPEGDWSQGLETKEEILNAMFDSDSAFAHRNGHVLFASTKLRQEDGVFINLGKPVNDFPDAKVQYNDQLFEDVCHSFLFPKISVRQPSLVNNNTMVVYSGAEPGSEEQIKCLTKHSLLFMRPKGVPFHGSN